MDHPHPLRVQTLDYPGQPRKTPDSVPDRLVLVGGTSFDPDASHLDLCQPFWTSHAVDPIPRPVANRCRTEIPTTSQSSTIASRQINIWDVWGTAIECPTQPVGACLHIVLGLFVMSAAEAHVLDINP